MEALRVDPAFLIGGTIRGNLFVSSVLALGFAMILLLRHSGLGANRIPAMAEFLASIPDCLLVHSVDPGVPREHLQALLLQLLIA